MIVSSSPNIQFSGHSEFLSFWASSRKERWNLPIVPVPASVLSGRLPPSFWTSLSSSVPSLRLRAIFRNRSGPVIELGRGLPGLAVGRKNAAIGTNEVHPVFGLHQQGGRNGKSIWLNRLRTRFEPAPISSGKRLAGRKAARRSFGN